MLFSLTQFVIEISNSRRRNLVTTIFNVHVITGNLILIGLEGSRSIQHGKSRPSLPEVLSRLRRSLPASGRSAAFGRPRHLTKACRERTSGTQGIFGWLLLYKKKAFVMLFATSLLSTMHFVYPQKFCISIVFNFSWDEL